MFCENCGNELNEGQKFCPKCGHKLEPVEVEKKELSDTTNSTDSDKHSEVLNFDIRALIYMHRHSRNFHTLVSIEDRNVCVKSTDYVLKEKDFDCVNFTFDEISNVEYKRSLVLDMMTKLRFGGAILFVLVGFVIPPAIIVGLAIAGLTLFLSSDPALVIKLKNGKKIKIFYEKKEQVSELYNVLTSK